MRISDWSSDVCSSDLSLFAQEPCRYRATSSCAPDSREWRRVVAARDRRTVHIRPKDARSSFSRPQKPIHDAVEEIGRASCRERVWQYVLISVVAVTLKKKKTKRISRT